MTLHVSHIQHRYSELSASKPVLNIDAFDAQQGEQILIVGASASGKSTFLDILAGIHPPRSGHVFLKEHGLYSMPAAHRNALMAQCIGYLPQIIGFVPELTVLENVEINLLQAGKFPTNLSRARAKAVLGQLGIFELANVYPRALSPAETVRAGIARAIAPMPQLILADEPTANLNEAESRFALNFLREISRSYNATLIVTTRNPTLASKFESIYYLYRGFLEPLSHLRTRLLAPSHPRHQSVYQTV